MDLRLRPDPASTPAAVPVAGGARLLRERRPELGARGLHQGAARRRRHRRAARLSWPSSRPSSGARTSTSPPSPTSTRSSARSTPTRSTSGSPSPGARPQARPRRHPRDRVLRPDPAADPGRPQPGPARPPHARRAGRAGRGRPCRAARRADELADAYRVPARASSTGCRCWPTSRPTACPRPTPSAGASPRSAGFDTLRGFDAAISRHAEGASTPATASCSPRRSRCRRGSAAWSSPASRTTRRPWRRSSAWAFPTRRRSPQTIRGWHHGRIAGDRAPSAAASCSPGWPRACWTPPRRPARRTRAFNRFGDFFSRAAARGCRCSRCSWPSRGCSSWWSR